MFLFGFFYDRNRADRDDDTRWRIGRMRDDCAEQKKEKKNDVGGIWTHAN